MSVKSAKNNYLEYEMFVRVCKSQLGVQVFREVKFHPKRRWRFDYAIPAYKIAIEVEGGVWTGGRHIRGNGFLGDIDKYNTATLMGWRVFRTTPENLVRTSTINMLKAAMCNGQTAYIDERNMAEIVENTVKTEKK